MPRVQGKPHVVLFDGANLVFRAFFAIRSLSNSDGLPTNALFGFTSMISKIIADEAPDYCAIVFDRGEPEARTKLYPEYKANRPEMPSDLRIQLPYLERIAAGYRLPFVFVVGVEADDIIATLAVQARDRGMTVAMVSSDKDLTQLVGGGIEMLDTMAQRRYDPAEVESKWGVRPDQMGDYLALRGDAADNIPGVAGVGAKTATQLLQSYGDIAGVYAHLDELPKGRRTRLEEGREAADLSRRLVELDCAVDVPVTLDDLIVKEPDAPVLSELFGELEFRTLQRQFAQPETTEALEARVVQSADALRDALAELESATALGVHPRYSVAEETGGGGRAVDWLGISISASNGAGEALPPQYWHLRLGGGAGLDPSEAAAGLEALGVVAEGNVAERNVAEEVVAESAHSSEAAKAVAMFDTKRFANALLELHRSGGPQYTLGPAVFDCQLASYIVDATKYKHTLPNIAIDWLGLDLAPPAPSKSKAKPSGDLFGADLGPVANEEAKAADALRRLHEPLAAALREHDLSSVMDDIERPLLPVLATMEHRGIRVESKVLREFSLELGTQLEELQARIYESAGETFKIGSPKQIGRILFEVLGLPVIKRTRTGPSTDASVLDALSEEHDIVRDIVEWRATSKLKNTYTDALVKLVSPLTGRIHAHINQVTAATGRLSINHPNLQAVPVRTAQGRRIREAFVAEDGHRLISADYSQIELRILAHLSGASRLVAAFEEGADIHSRTAATVFDVPEAEVTAEQRRRAKAINFGILYGMGATRLAADLGIARKEAKAIIETYFERFPDVRGFLDSTLERAKAEGSVHTLLGRRRRLPDLNSPNRMAASAAERMAVNTPVQGSAADIIKVAMVRLHRRLEQSTLEARLLLQVHDEVIVECPSGQVDEVGAIVREEMEGAAQLRVPLVVHVGSGQNWSEAH